MIQTQRMTINGKSEDELKKRIVDLKKRGYYVVTPVKKAPKTYYEPGKRGRFNHSFRFEQTAYVAVLERKWDIAKKVVVTDDE